MLDQLWLRKTKDSLIRIRYVDTNLLCACQEFNIKDITVMKPGYRRKL